MLLRAVLRGAGAGGAGRLFLGKSYTFLDMVRLLSAAVQTKKPGGSCFKGAAGLILSGPLLDCAGFPPELGSRYVPLFPPPILHLIQRVLYRICHEISMVPDDLLGAAADYQKQPAGQDAEGGLADGLRDCAHCLHLLQRPYTTFGEELKNFEPCFIKECM